jgi:hypothetical protein
MGETNGHTMNPTTRTRHDACDRLEVMTMCFEWDKRYFREQEELRISKEKAEALLRRAEEAARAEAAEAEAAAEKEAASV